MSDTEVRNVIIIGGGPTGYTAGIYAARGALDPLVIAGYQAGGQLMLTTDVENYPGFPEGVKGPKLMDDFREQAERFGADIINEDVTEVDFSSKPFTVKTYDKEFKAHSVIVSTGASAKWLGLENEQELIGSGLSSCATCDGAFYKDKTVAVVGGGDSAMEESTFLTKFAKKVYVIHRRNELRASKIMGDRAKKNDKIEFVWDTVVAEYLSEKDGFVNKLVGAKLENTETGETEELELDGLFMAIGHKPNTDFLGDELEKDDHGYLLTDEHTMTKIPGVFAAGDVVDTRYRQAITAAGDGCRAAMDAEKWLSEEGIVE